MSRKYHEIKLYSKKCLYYYYITIDCLYYTTIDCLEQKQIRLSLNKNKIYRTYCSLLLEPNFIAFILWLRVRSAWFYLGSLVGPSSCLLELPYRQRTVCYSVMFHLFFFLYLWKTLKIFLMNCRDRSSLYVIKYLLVWIPWISLDTKFHIRLNTLSRRFSS